MGPPSGFQKWWEPQDEFNSAKFRHPSNGYVEESLYPWLFGILFGPFYLLYKRAYWGAIWYVVGLFIIAVVLGYWHSPPAINALVLFVVYPIGVMRRLVRQAYLRRGWIEVTE